MVAKLISKIVLFFSAPSTAAFIFVWLAQMDGNEPLVMVNGLCIGFFTLISLSILLYTYTNIFHHFGFVKETKFLDVYCPNTNNESVIEPLQKIELVFFGMFVATIITYLIAIVLQTIIHTVGIVFIVATSALSVLVTFLIFKKMWYVACEMPSPSFKPNIKK